MANAVYDNWKDLIGSAGLGLAALDLTAATVKVALVDTGVYTFSQSHDFFNDVSSAVVGTPQELGTPQFVGKNFDGADVTYSGLTGDTVEAIVIYVDTGTEGTSPLVAYLDTGVTGLPLTPSGADVTLTWDAAGIFDL